MSLSLEYTLATVKRGSSSVLGAVARKFSRPVVLSLLLLEKGIYLFLYLLSIMEEDPEDDVFANDELRFGGFESEPNNVVNVSVENIEMRRMSAPEDGMPARSLSLPNVNDVGKTQHLKQLNPVKEFISNFVNRGKAHKKRAPIQHAVTTESIAEGTNVAETKRIGVGHTFLSCHLRNPTWCDLCGEFIWGLFKQSVRCKSKYNTLISLRCI